MRLPRRDKLRRSFEWRPHRWNFHYARLAVSRTANWNLASKARQLSGAIVALGLFAASGCGRPGQQPTAITHVAVIDVISGRALTDYTVVIRGTRISYAGPSSRANIPQNARIVDGRGKFLVPGLWDMHVHAFMFVFSDFAGPLMIANGVTGAREMGYYVDTTLRWRRDIAAGVEIGPRLVAGVRVDGPIGHTKFVSHIKDPTDAVRAVDTLARGKGGSRRADFLSVDPLIPRAAYAALAEEAKKLKVPFAGKVPYAVSVEEASDAGQGSLEQEDDVIRACTRSESAFRTHLSDTTKLRAGDDPLQLPNDAITILSSYDAAKCAKVLQTLARNGTRVTPTLVLYQPYASNFDSAATHPERSRYVPGIIQGGWLEKANPKRRPDPVVVKSSFSLERTRALAAAGVKLLAGTDAPRAFIYPGFSVHDELALLVRAGLTPIEALRTATYNPAEYFGALDSLGTVTTGKLADLVLLDANPLADIHNTTRISLVIANGRVFDSSARAALLKHVETALKH